MGTAARLLTIGAVLAALLAPASVPPAAAHCGYFTLETLRVEAKASAKSYRRGDTVVIKGVVTRPAERDPIQAGVEWGELPVATPAEGADVSADFWMGWTNLWNRDYSNEDGKFTIRIKIPEGLKKTGTANLAIAARIYHNQGGCPDGEEQGFAYYPKMFAIH